MGAAEVGIEVLMHVEGEVGRRSVRIGDVVQRLGRAGFEKAVRALPLRSGQEDQLRGGAGVADTMYDGLQGHSPFVQIGDVMRFVHDAHHHSRRRGIVGGELAPETDKVIVGGPALADDAAVPSGIVVDVHDAVGTRVQTSLDYRWKRIRPGGVRGRKGGEGG